MNATDASHGSIRRTRTVGGTTLGEEVVSPDDNYYELRRFLRSRGVDARDVNNALDGEALIKLGEESKVLSAAQRIQRCRTEGGSVVAEAVLAPDHNYYELRRFLRSRGVDARDVNNALDGEALMAVGKRYGVLLAADESKAPWETTPAPSYSAWYPTPDGNPYAWVDVPPPTYVCVKGLNGRFDLQRGTQTCQLPQSFQLQLQLIPPHCDNHGRTKSMQRVMVNVSMTVAEVRSQVLQALRDCAGHLVISWRDPNTGRFTDLPLDKTVAETHMFIHQATLKPMEGIVGCLRGS